MPRGVYPRKPGESYGAKHLRVRRERGPARTHACAHECGKQAREWATIHDTDGMKPEDYLPLCGSCHQKYDDVPGRRLGGHRNKGRRRPDNAARNEKNVYARPCAVGCTCGKHRKSASEGLK